MSKLEVAKILNQLKESYKGAITYYDELTIIEQGTVKDYTWKDIDTKKRKKTKVIYFLVKNTEKGTVHVVTLGVNPFAGSPAIWCGDTELKEKFGLKDYCSFWKNDRQCKHCSFVLAYIDDHPELLKELVATKKSSSPATRLSSREKEVELILNSQLPALIYGVTGSGKTYTVLKVLQQKKKAGELDYTVINLTSGIEDTDLLAKFVPTPDGKWEVKDGELWRAFKEAQNLPDGKRYVIVLEELTRATPKALNILVKALDGVGRNYRLQNFVTGEELAVPKSKLQFIGLANLGSSYSGTEELDPALMRRFLITRFWNYDEGAEVEILKALGLKKNEIVSVMKLVKMQRDAYRRGEFPYPIDTGTLRKWVELKKKLNLSWWESFEMTALYRIVDRDSLGYPDESQIETLKELFKELELA